MKITFAEIAWAEYVEWQSLDKKTLKKINSLLKDIQRNPYSGEGKPEQLKGNKSGDWSRRINEKDRLVYQIQDEFILIKQCKGHYDNK